MPVDTPVGNTLPDMAVTIGICLLYHEVSYAVNGRKREKIRDGEFKIEIKYCGTETDRLSGL